MITNKIKLIIFLLLFCLFLLFLFLNTNKPFYNSLESLHLSIIPDYQRTLSELTLTIPKKTSLEKETLDLLNNNYANLLLNLPSYTKIDIFTHKENQDILEKFTAKLEIPNEINYHFSVDDYLEIWAQDYFEAVNNGSSRYLLLPTTTNKLPSFNRIEQRNSSFKSLENSLTAPFFFEGGNILSAKNSVGDFIFIDFEIIKKTQDLYRLKNKYLFDFQVKKLIQKTFPDYKIVVLGDKRRRENFIHLDQSILFLENNLVVINSIVDAPKSEATSQHKLYKKQLEALGFKTILLPISIKDVESSISSLNAITFRNSLTNKNSVIFPVYPNELKDLSLKKSSFKKDDLQGNALYAFKLFSELNYLPIPVLDDTLFKKNGSLHCISNVTR